MRALDGELVEKRTASPVGMAFPPAWEDVRSVLTPRPHQATGRHLKGRRYRYHPDWNEITTETAHDVVYASQLPRCDVKLDLKKGMTPNTVAALVVRLMDFATFECSNEYAGQRILRTTTSICT